MNPTVRLAAAILLAVSPLAALAETPAPPAEAIPIYDTTSDGALAIEAASHAAGESGRRLFVNFGTNDCVPCQVVNDTIYEQPFLTAFFGQFVPVFVDVSAGSKNRALLERYGIDPGKGFPAIVLSDDALRVAEITKEGELAIVGAKGKEAVQEWILKRFNKKEARR